MNRLQLPTFELRKIFCERKGVAAATDAEGVFTRNFNRVGNLIETRGNAGIRLQPNEKWSAEYEEKDSKNTESNKRGNNSATKLKNEQHENSRKKSEVSCPREREKHSCENHGGDEINGRGFAGIRREKEEHSRCETAENVRVRKRTHPANEHFACRQRGFGDIESFSGKKTFAKKMEAELAVREKLRDGKGSLEKKSSRKNPQNRLPIENSGGDEECREREFKQPPKMEECEQRIARERNRRGRNREEDKKRGENFWRRNGVVSQNISGVNFLKKESDTEHKKSEEKKNLARVNKESEIFIKKIERIGLAEINEAANSQRDEKNSDSEKKLGNAKKIYFLMKPREFEFSREKHLRNFTPLLTPQISEGLALTFCC